MQSQRTFKQQSFSYIDGKDLPVMMKIENILLKVYKSAENILEQICLQNLSEIIENASKSQEQCLKSIESGFLLLLSQIQIMKQKNTISVDHNDYQVLQQSLQKAQSEVRKHIRIEQQLKLYLDGIEQKNENLQKQLKIQELKYHQLFESIKGIDQQKKQLQKKLKKIEQKNKYLTDRQKLKGHKSVKVITQSLNRAQNYSIGMYKLKPTLTNHQHSKSRTSDKSFEKQKNQAVIGIERKSSKLKNVDQHISVNLYKKDSQQFRQQKQKTLYDEAYVPTEQDIRIFRQMTKTVQMKQAYKRPVRKVTKFKTESKEGKESKELKANTIIQQGQNRQYRSVSMYK